MKGSAGPWNRGATLIEMGVALGIFSLLGVLLALSFTKSYELWRRTSGGSDAQVSLRKVRNRITQDLSETSFTSVGKTDGPSSLGPFDGSAIWFLSAVNHTTGEFMRTSNGTPFWQNHVLYYAVVPENHAALVGFDCTGGGVDGFEVQCPHKVVIRKVIDNGALTDPSDEGSAEIPFAQADPKVGVAAIQSRYLTRPNGLDTSAMLLEDGVVGVSIVATNILSFNVSLGKDPAKPREIEIETAAVSLPSAQKVIAIGQEVLKGTVHESRVIIRAHPRIR